MNKIDEGLNQLDSSLKKDLAAQLAIGQVSGESYNPDIHAFLQTTLKMTECVVTKELDEKKKVIELTSLKMDVMAEFEKIQKEFGSKIILNYAGLVKLCNDHNLYYAHSSVFNGNITPEALKEASAFNFARARTILRVGQKSVGAPVVSWNYDNGSQFDLIIVAPITMFKLDSPNRVLISNREIIEHPKGYSPKPKGECSEHDPVMLLPFRAADKQIYFIVITNWEV